MAAPNENRHTMFITMGTHCDLFWMGTHTECLEAGTAIQRHALDLMEQHPDYCYYIETTIFADYHLRKYPEDKPRMRRLMDEGRLEIGACFVDRVEHSHNGESIIRHAVEGIRWLNDTFGRGPRTAMHPDLPGISPQLPQIYAQAGIGCYLRARGFGATYDWIAPDGSHIVYCNLFGYGEKTPQHFEAVLREPDLPQAFFVRGGYSDLQDVSIKVLDIVATLRREHPHVDFQFASPGRVLSQLREQALPRLWGEMPYGWGSLASAFIRLMAQSVELEHGLLTAEKLAALARGLGLEIAPIEPVEPKGPSARWLALHRLQGDIFGEPIREGDELRELWRYELLCQDHNYAGYHGAQSSWDKEIMRDHALAEVSRWINGGLLTLAGPGQGQRLIVFNPVSWRRDEVLTIPDRAPETLEVLAADGAALPAQPTHDGLTIQVDRLPSLGVQTLYLRRGEPKAQPILSDNCLVGEHLEVDINTSQGRISRLFDRSIGQDLIAHGGEHGFGELVSYRDPGVDVRYNFTGEVASDALVNYQIVRRADGPLYAGITLAGEFLSSRIEKEYVLYKQLRRLDVTLRLWWWGKREEHLRLCFPFSTNDFVETWYGVPFGAVRWPEMLHGDGIKDEFTLSQGAAETMDMLAPDDRQHFREVIGWLDLNYTYHGVTIGTRATCWWINDAELHASLLRTQFSCGDGNLWSLNPGFHQWTFRIRPHAGDWREGQSYRVGEESLNSVACLVDGDGPDSQRAPDRVSPSAVDVVPQHVTITAFKPSDFQRDALIVRVLECAGRAADVALAFPFTVRHAEKVNLLEEEAEPLEMQDGRVHFALRPHQFQTVRLYL